MSVRRVLGIVGLGLVLLAGMLAAPGPAARAQAPSPSLVTTVTTTLPVSDGSGPHFTGRTEPSMAQRIADSLIWLWLLAVLVLAPVIWVWTGRRARRTDGGSGATSAN